jgi:hypothetical protein
VGHSSSLASSFVHAWMQLPIIISSFFFFLIFMWCEHQTLVIKARIKQNIAGNIVLAKNIIISFTKDTRG